MKKLDKITFTYTATFPVDVLCGTPKEIQDVVEEGIKKAGGTKLKLIDTKCKWRKE